MARWSKALWDSWTVRCARLWEIQLEMMCAIAATKLAFQHYNSTAEQVILDRSLSPQALDELQRFKLQPPAFLDKQKIKFLKPSNAADVFATKIEKIDLYLNNDLHQLALSLQQYLSLDEHDLRDKLKLECRLTQAAFPKATNDEVLLIAGFNTLTSNDAMRFKSPPTVDDFIDSLINGKFVKNMFHRDRIHYAVSIYKLRALLCRGVLLRTKDPTVITDKIGIASRIKALLKEFDVAAAKHKKSYAHNYVAKGPS